VHCIRTICAWSLAAALALAPGVALSEVAAAGTWQSLDNGGGISVWKRDIPGSPIVAFRGEAMIDASIAKVAQVLSDTARKTEWVASAAVARDVRQISALERIEYNRTVTPIILKDRDFVFRAVTEVDREARRVRITMNSVEDPAVPVDPHFVRGRLLASCYILTACADQRTRVEVEIQADPLGSVPKWVVNFFQKSWPRKTLEGIRRQAARADVGEHPLLRDWSASSPR
jgi:hypothetical protein